MKLSIIFITYNRGDELIRAIESCFPINVKEYEIIIWDNNSVEEEKDKILNYVNSKDKKIKYFYSEQNLGVAGGRNEAWKKSLGDFVFFLDDDAVIQSEKFFPKIIDYMNEHKNVGAVACNVFEPKTNNKLIPKDQYKTNDGVIQVLSYIGCAFMLRRSSIKTENLYPEKLLFGSEELYSSLIIWNDGFEVHLYNEGIIFHMPSVINRYSGNKRAMNFIINGYIVRLLTYPFWLVPILKFTLLLRIKNHKLNNNECRLLIKERYDIKEIHRISNQTTLMLTKKYGIKKMI